MSLFDVIVEVIIGENMVLKNEVMNEFSSDEWGFFWGKTKYWGVWSAFDLWCVVGLSGDMSNTYWSQNAVSESRVLTTQALHTTIQANSISNNNRLACSKPSHSSPICSGNQNFFRLKSWLVSLVPGTEWSTPVKSLSHTGQPPLPWSCCNTRPYKYTVWSVQATCCNTVRMKGLRQCGANFLATMWWSLKATLVWMFGDLKFTPSTDCIFEIHFSKKYKTVVLTRKMN